MIKVVSIDPGVTTGIATGIIAPGTPMMVGAMEEVLEVWDMWDWLCEQMPNIIVYERFEFRRNKHVDGVEFFPKELIGVIRLYWKAADTHLRLPECAMYPRMPGQDWNYFTDTKLKDDGVYKATKGGHCNDAMRHLLGWFTFGPGYKYNKHGYTPS